MWEAILNRTVFPRDVDKLFSQAVSQALVDDVHFATSPFCILAALVVLL